MTYHNIPLHTITLHYTKLHYITLHYLHIYIIRTSIHNMHSKAHYSVYVCLCNLISKYARKCTWTYNIYIYIYTGIGTDSPRPSQEKEHWLTCWLSTGQQDFYLLHVIACMVNIHGCGYTGFGSQLSFLCVADIPSLLQTFLCSALVHHLTFYTGSRQRRI